MWESAEKSITLFIAKLFPLYFAEAWEDMLKLVIFILAIWLAEIAGTK